MRSLSVVEDSRLFGQHLGLFECGEDFHVQALVPELSIEALVVSVLPGLARHYEERFDLYPGQPTANGLGDELRAIVGADVLWRSMTQERIGKDIEHILAVLLALDMDGQALARELVDDGEETERLAVMGAVLDEVIGPDVVAMPRT